MFFMLPYNDNIYYALSNVFFLSKVTYGLWCSYILLRAVGDVIKLDKPQQISEIMRDGVFETEIK